jgi:hypothetical protein
VTTLRRHLTLLLQTNTLKSHQEILSIKKYFTSLCSIFPPSSPIPHPWSTASQSSTKPCNCPTSSASTCSATPHARVWARSLRTQLTDLPCHRLSPLKPSTWNSCTSAARSNQRTRPRISRSHRRTPTKTVQGILTSYSLEGHYSAIDLRGVYVARSRQANVIDCGSTA